MKMRTIVLIFLIGVCYMLQGSIYKNVLPNGLTLLVMPRNDIPKVSLQMWYNVGSKDEKTGEYGIAHLIEHMIFKGTENLSESDINMITYKLSGSCNAFTSHDYTGYLFDMPSQHWFEVLPVMADCMSNCTFKQEFLNSELKAVVQEIKMYNDSYVSVLLEEMMSAIFKDHPYRFPVIGYKQDLWNLNRDNLVNFYHKHYGPNNATLVIVGDVIPTDVYERVKDVFGEIPALPELEERDLYHSPDIVAHNVVVHRDIQQPMALFAWTIPGVSYRKEYLFDLMSWLLGSGRGSCLYQKLVTELGIATELQAMPYDLFDYGLFCLYVQPRELDDLEQIKSIITQEIERYRNEEVSDEELKRAQKKTDMDFLNLQEDNHRTAYLWGKTFLATGDENYLINFCDYPADCIKCDIKDLFKTYFSPSLMHSGTVVPIEKEDNDLWLAIQQTSDAEDARILDGIIRDEHVEPCKYADKVTIEKPQGFNYPKPQKFVLSNGLTVLYYNKPDIDKIDVILDLKTKHFYDSPDQQGLYMFMSDLLQEGTQNYTAQELAYELESNGMHLHTFPGNISISMLSADAEKGLGILNEVLTRPTFDAKAIEHTRTQMLSELKMFWDVPVQFSAQLLREKIYKNHPYAQLLLGRQEAIAQATREDIVREHKRFITPQGARIALVGNLNGYDVKDLLEKTLGSWSGQEIEEPGYPELAWPEPHIFEYAINRDQTILCYGGLSVNRFNEDYDKLLLFDQVFTGGVLGGMNSRLFALREKTGLFYAIGGSLLAGADKQPGMIYLRAIVSPDKIEQAEKIIDQAIAEGAQNLTEQELEEAKRALANSMVDHFMSNKKMASTFIALDTYDFPENYFDIRPGQLYDITVDDVKKAVAKYLDLNKMVKMKVGRV